MDWIRKFGASKYRMEESVFMRSEVQIYCRELGSFPIIEGDEILNPAFSDFASDLWRKVGDVVKIKGRSYLIDRIDLFIAPQGKIGVQIEVVIAKS